LKPLKNSILCLEDVLKQERMTKFIKPEDADQKWYLVDAKDQVLGRLAVKIARVIRGKNKAFFTPNMDTGDFVVVINADKIRVTGKRESQKEYFSYSGYPGGAKYRSYAELMAKKPEWVVENAVKGMLPKTRLGKKIIKKLKVYAGESHPHTAQKPVELK
jgi:large subunit ribosomal protein L13